MRAKSFMLGALLGCCLLALGVNSVVSTLLENFQVMEPPVVPDGPSCNITLLQYDFATSYNAPAIVSYSAPTECGEPGSWAAVVLTWYCTSMGVQFDRLGSLYIDAIEIWRTSTPEPLDSGIFWTATKDVTHYMPLLALSNATLMLDLGNVISGDFTASFNVTLTATYYQPTTSFPKPTTPDQIVGLSNGNETVAAYFETPPIGVTEVVIPENTASAFVEIYASGNSDEEFWYTNIVDEYLAYADPTGNASTIDIGGGPFREVQLWIDGMLAGVVFPFAVVYTGGFIVSWWRPMVAYGAFSSPTYNLDITPFLPLLTDSLPHNFLLTVSSGLPDTPVNSNWYLSGNIALVLDPSGEKTTGSITHYESTPWIDVNGRVRKDNETVEVWVEAGRRHRVEGAVTTGSGGNKSVVFEQGLEYRNYMKFFDGGFTQTVNQSNLGTTISSHSGTTVLSETYTFPITLFSNQTTSSKYLSGNLSHGYTRSLLSPISGISTFIDTNQFSNGSVKLNRSSELTTGGVGTEVSGVAFTEEKFGFEDSTGWVYGKDVGVFNLTLLWDENTGNLAF